VGESCRCAQRSNANLNKAAKEMRLNNHLHGTKYTEVTEMPTDSRKNKVDDQEFERTRELKYLGSTLTHHNDISIEIEQRIVMANRARYGLKKQLSS
jgi:hypothetical protein